MTGTDSHTQAAAAAPATPAAAAPVAAEAPRPHHLAGETSDSPQRPSQRVSGRMLDFDLEQAIARLRGEPAWARGQRNAITLVKEPDVRVILTLLKPGAHVQEHQVETRFTLHALTGRLRVHLPKQSIDVAAGHLLALEGGIAHELEALEETAFLLTIPWTTGQDHH